MISQISELKEKLNLIEKNLTDKMENFICLESKWETYEVRLKDIQNTKVEDIIKINVGGKKFETTMKTLMNVKDNLFHKIIESGKFDIRKGIFIDRSPVFFNDILEYFRSGKFNHKRYTNDQLIELKEEIIYYEVLPLEDLFTKKIITNLKYISMECTNYYIDYDGNSLGSREPSVLFDRNLNTGVLTNSGATLTIGLNDEFEFEEVEVGGFTGEPDWIYADGYGVGSRIETSLDKNKWTIIGTIPPGFGQTIKKIQVTKTRAKYVRFSHGSWIGLGYFNIAPQ